MLQIDYSIIGKRIADIRRKQKLTQSQLAEKADISNNYLSHIETAKSTPSLETIINLCIALNATPNEVLLGTKTTEKNYLNTDILDKLELCNTRQKQLIFDFINLILSNDYAKK